MPSRPFCAPVVDQDGGGSRSALAPLIRRVRRSRVVTTSHRGGYLGTMPRWEHGSEGRLREAARELFGEQGFEATSAVQIAKRARVTTRTFFRYFPDKEEVLFADAGALNAAPVLELLQKADVTEPLAAVARTLAGFDWEKLGSREFQRER